MTATPDRPHVGTVTARPGARLHRAVHGRAYCGAGRGVITGPAVALDACHMPRVCRRCAPGLRAVMRQAPTVAGTPHTSTGCPGLAAAIANALRPDRYRWVRADEVAAGYVVVLPYNGNGVLEVEQVRPDGAAVVLSGWLSDPRTGTDVGRVTGRHTPDSPVWLVDDLRGLKTYD